LPEDRLKAAETYCNIVNDFCPSADRKELLRRIILEMDCPKNPLSPWLVKKHFKRGLADGTWDKPYKSLIEGLELRVQDYPKDTYKASAIISKFCPKEMKDKIAYCVVNSKDRLEAALDEIIASEAKRING